ncbi:FG-GAP-like repeat-containing protein [Streptomyces sp. NPDC051636]|uniref:FG-GAP-like repeat-containing protein n=1 Tax=Streptomyces sp. NPDC051636 TaxID=3365663 RepID=UPI0037AEE32B
MHRRKWLSFVIVAIVAAVMSAGALSAPPSQAVENGRIETSHLLPIVQIWRKAEGSTGARYICAGTAVSLKWGLTAAHCFDDTGGQVGNSYEVRFGSLRRGEGTRLDIEYLETRGDVAIVRVSGAGFRGVNYAKLPNSKQVPRLRTTFTSWGWGRTCATCGPSAELRKTDAKVIDNEKGLQDAKGGSAYKVRTTYGKLWQGDSGGPNGEWDSDNATLVQHGVASRVVTGSKDVYMSYLAGGDNGVYEWLIGQAGMGIFEGGHTELRKRDLRVMPLGDSITAGFKSSDGNGYRDELHRELTAAENKVDYVGSGSDGTMSDRDHEGHSGWPISDIDGAANNAVPTFRPNVVLIHAGTNDLKRGAPDPNGAPGRLAKLLDDVIEDAPDAAVIVAQVVPSKDDGTNDRINAFNGAISGIVEQRAKAGKHILSVDMGGLDPDTDLADELHPNDAGYDMMADIWYQGINRAAARGWISDPNSAPPAGHTACPTKPIWHPWGQVASGGGTSTGGPMGGYVDFADLNGDGRDDYLIVKPTGAVVAYMNGGVRGRNQDAIWYPWGQVASGGLGDDVRFADLNGDGRDDYLIVSPQGAVTLYLNGGLRSPGQDAIWHPWGQVASGGLNGPNTHIDFADLNGDRRAEYLIVDNYSGAVTAYVNGGLQGRNQNAIWHPWGQIADGDLGDNMAVRFADLNGDGRDDYVMVAAHNGAAAEYVNGGLRGRNENALWLPQGQIASGGGSPGSLVKFADLNGDIREDYLALNNIGAVNLFINGC